MNCFVVGAGMAGLTAARVLAAAGCRVTVLDKGWNPGGRMATRRVDGRVFDHGAQFFTARGEEFRRTVRFWAERGWVRPWCEVDGVTRWVAVDGMNGLARELASGLDIRQQVKVDRVEPAGGDWRVLTASGEVLEGAVILTAPAAQCLDLLPEGLFAEELRGVQYEPCFAVMVGLEGASAVPAPGYVDVNEGPVEWIADNTQKGVSRGPGSDVTVHSRGEWARANWDRPLEDVGRDLVEAAAPWLGAQVVTLQVHRWKYAKATRGPGERALVTGRLAIAGDGLGGARVEGAFVSGLEAAEKLMAKGARAAV